jgi:arginyl-tRNA--protein-N-Asp/Glu arginylyltransferase
MDYDKMTLERLCDWIFKQSGYKVNWQDCKSRIENICVKYAEGEFTINSHIHNVTKRNWFQRQRIEYRYLMYMGTGILIGLMLPYVW